MTVTAKLKYLRIAPRKVRMVADLIRGKKAEKAQTLLNFTVKGGAKPLSKLLKSATDSAQNNFQLDPSNLYISKITVDGGPIYKRWRARSRGQAFGIQKKTSHITIVLEEVIKKVKKSKKARPKTAEQAGKIKKVSKIEKPSKKDIAEEKPKIFKEIKTKHEKEISKPKMERGTKRVFRRKSF